MKFDINNYNGNYAMHCKTEEEAKDFCNYLHKIGRRWITGGSYAQTTCYEEYKGDTIYYFNKGTYGSICTYFLFNSTTKILEWSDYMNKEFTKADLKTGDVVLRRNGDVEIVIKEHNVLIRPRECNRLDDFNEDLTHSFLNSGDVVTVRRPKIPTDCQFSAFKEKRGTLVYERKEVEEMTLEEVCKALGKEIKIVTRKEA